MEEYQRHHKQTGLSEKPQNVRLLVEDHSEIKRLAKRAGRPHSDVHRELISEALRARRQSIASPASHDTPEAHLITAIERVENSLAEVRNTVLPTLRDEVQILSSRLDYLSGQIAQLGSTLQQSGANNSPPFCP